MDLDPKYFPGCKEPELGKVWAEMGEGMLSHVCPLHPLLQND